MRFDAQPPGQLLSACVACLACHAHARLTLQFTRAPLCSVLQDMPCHGSQLAWHVLQERTTWPPGGSPGLLHNFGHSLGMSVPSCMAGQCELLSLSDQLTRLLASLVFPWPCCACCAGSTPGQAACMKMHLKTTCLTSC